ncbi:hypothetical protein C3943_02325 [Lysinibacillus sp. B2A1]|nr:hypothetical protein C3943_02325 [Lysinibacillus sp. B2A1]
MKNTPNYNLNKPDGNDYAKIESLNENADIIDTELKRISKAIGNGSAGNDILSRLNELENQVGNLPNLETTQKANLVAAINEVRKSAINAWQKGVYNDTNITNLGKKTVSRTFNLLAEEWTSSVNVENFYILIPVVNFSGIIKVTYATSGAYSAVSGGTEVIHNIAKYEGDLGYYSKTILSISPSFARDYFIGNIDYNATGISLPLYKAPAARNPITVKVEMIGTYDTLFADMKNTTSGCLDTGSPTAHGYPWTPQSSQIPSYAQIASWNERAHYIAVDRDGSDPDTETSQFFVTNHPNAGGGWWYIENRWLGWVGNSQMQVAYGYNHTDFKVRYRYSTDPWQPWSPSLQQTFQSVSEGKADNRAALAQKGVSIPQDPTFAQISQGIMQVKTGRLDSIAVTIPGIPPNGVVSVVVAVDFYPWHAMMNLDGVVLRNGVITGNNWANRFSVYNIRVVFDSGTLWKVYFDIRGGLQGTGEQTNTIFLAPKMD